MWYELAFRLGQPVAFVQRWTTSTQFVLWMEFLEKKERQNTKEHYYLAQIAAEIRGSNTRIKKPKRINVKDFLLKFSTRKKKAVNSKEQKMQRSKSFWFGVAGIGKKKVKRKGK